MSRFTENSKKSIFWAQEMLNLPHFGHKKNSLQKCKTATFNQFLLPVFSYNTEKSNDQILRKLQKNVDFAPKNTTFTQFLGTVKIPLKNPKMSLLITH